MVNCQGRIEWVQSGGFLPPTRARLYREAGATSLKHAIIVTGGKQYRVAEGDVIFVEKLDVEAGETVKFDRVLAVIDEDKAVFGTPWWKTPSFPAMSSKTARARRSAFTR